MKDSNSGNRNSGDCNSGNFNSGDWNSGNRNSGASNSGDWNSGNWNSGDFNSDNRNSGNRNSGNRNSGDFNSGNRNSGDCNSGDCNSGNFNSGDWNSGNWNSGDCNSGLFNTTEPPLRMFNKECPGLLRSDVAVPDIFYFDLVAWVNSADMTDAEKRDYPDHETTGGYLKTYEYKEAWRMAWENASAQDRANVKGLPNFDADIFFEITGIHVDEEPADRIAKLERELAQLKASIAG